MPRPKNMNKKTINFFHLINSFAPKKTELRIVDTNK